MMHEIPKVLGVLHGGSGNVSMGIGIDDEIASSDVGATVAVMILPSLI